MEDTSKKSSLTINSIFYLIYNILNVFFPLITSIYVSHILLPSYIGLVESARNFTSYFVILAYLGIPTYGIREIAKCKTYENRSKIYSELMIINSISTFTFLLLYFVLVLSIPMFREYFFLYLITGVAIALNFLNNSWLYEGLEKFKFISIRNLVFKVISFMLLIFLVKNENDYLWYTAILVIGTAGNYLLNIIQSHKFVKFSFKNIELKQHLKPILYLVVVYFAIEIYSLVDITMLGFWCDNETIAYYSYGLRIFKICIQILNTFTIVIVPRIAFFYKREDYDSYNRIITNTFKIIVMLSIPMIIGIYFVSDYLLTFIYGSSYINSAPVLKILSINLLFSPIGYLLGSRVLLVTSNENKMIIPVILGAIINVILNSFLIQLYQEIGASIASVISEFFVMLIYIFISHKLFKLNNCFKSFLLITISSILMLFFLLLSRMMNLEPYIIVIIQIIGSLIIYFGSLLLMREEFVSYYFNKIICKLKIKN